MGPVEFLRWQHVAVDAAPVIYYVERHPRYFELVRPFFEAVGDGQILVTASFVILMEVLVVPIRRDDQVLVQQYREVILGWESITPVPLTEEIAEEAAMLRALHNISTPDAIHVATAIREGATAFVTNDARLANLGIDLRMIVLEELLGNPVQ